MGEWMNFTIDDLAGEDGSNKKTCECGQDKAQREEDRKPHFHSSWCPVYKPEPKSAKDNEYKPSTTLSKKWI